MTLDSLQIVLQILVDNTNIIQASSPKTNCKPIWRTQEVDFVHLLTVNIFVDQGLKSGTAQTFNELYLNKSYLEIYLWTLPAIHNVASFCCYIKCVVDIHDSKGNMTTIVKLNAGKCTRIYCWSNWTDLP